MQVNVMKIKGLMAENGDTQEDLAKKLGCSVATVGNYLTGKSEMRIATLNLIAQIYNTAPLDLLLVNG